MTGSRQEFRLARQRATEWNIRITFLARQLWILLDLTRKSKGKLKWYGAKQIRNTPAQVKIIFKAFFFSPRSWATGYLSCSDKTVFQVQYTIIRRGVTNPINSPMVIMATEWARLTFLVGRSTKHLVLLPEMSSLVLRRGKRRQARQMINQPAMLMYRSYFCLQSWKRKGYMRNQNRRTLMQTKK